MATYVVKNERGEWLRAELLDWTPAKEDRCRWDASNGGKATAFAYAHMFGGKVYRIRKVTARREREAIVAFIDRVAATCGDDVRRSLALVSHRISSGEHRRKPCRST